MSRLHTTLTLTLALVAAGSLLYAWELRKQLSEAEAGRAVAKIEQGRLQKRVASLEQEFSAPASSPRPAPVRDSGPAAPAADSPLPPGRERFAELRDSPEMQKLMALQQRGALDSRYASLFKKLNLSPADLERLKNLLVEKQSAATDVFAAARAQGLNPRDNRDQVRQLVTNAEAEVDASIQSTLGDGVYQQYKQYEQTLPQRAVVSQLDQRLSYSAAPLDGNQTEQLVSLLAASSPTRNPANPVPAFAQNGGPGQPFFGGRGVQISDNVVTQSQTFLTAPQVDALRQLQQEQAAAAALRQQMRDRVNPTGGTASQPPGRSGP